MRKKIKGSNILVTGGAGFIGSHLVDELIKEGANLVVIIDNMFLGKESNLKDAIKNGAILYKDDAEFRDSLEYIIKKHKIDIVFNLATKALNYSFINPKNAFDTNVCVMGNLLELQRNGLFKTLCHYSSSEVYGSAVYEPMDEKHPYNPTTTYAGGKAAADIMLKTYVNMFDLDAFIIRPFNNYGPRQNSEGPLAGVIPITTKKIMDNISPEIHGNGKQSRDFIFVTDTVKATMKLYEKMKKGDEVNVSSMGQISIKNLIEKICDVMKFDGEIIYKEKRGADVETHNSTNEYLHSLIDFKPTNFDDGLNITINWYKENL